MGKKKHKSGGATGRAFRELENFKHRDLQRACVVRGMSFTEVVESTTPGLSNWFMANYSRGQDSTLLNQFDAWVEDELGKLGRESNDPVMSPHLRLGYIGEVDEFTGKVVIKRPKGIKKAEKEKRERDEVTHIFLGTKKALTYECAKEKLSIPETIEKVMAQFPEAVEKSIKIWYGRAKKQYHGKK